ncbi:flagellar basal body-associated protein FliL [Salinarimonas sp.]|uniref:flagellar basal body-associated protein FliL n=1 Tax=Salinarimonas sp. TaxID=2766526 RepID=UPI00391AEBEF
MAKKPRNDDEGSETEGGEATASGSRRKLVVIGGAVAALLVLGGGGAAFFLMGPSEEEVAAEAAAAAAEAAARPASFVEVREMVVNLAPEPNEERPRFLRFSVRLEVSDPRAVDTIQPLMPRVEDAFQTFVRELRPSDLYGSAGVYRLREELLRRVNIAVHPARVDAVLFREVVVQ